MSRNIGIKVKMPETEPDQNDKKNPFNGTLSVRGKLFEGKHNKLKSEFSVFRLNLFSLFKLKLIIAPWGIFLKISNKTFAEVVVLPSARTFKSTPSPLSFSCSLIDIPSTLSRVRTFLVV